MIIILEGPDGAGKSYLGRQLETALGGEYVPSPSLHNQMQFDDVTYSQEDMAYSGKLYILDRVTWISELIYSKALNRTPRISLGAVHSYWKMPQIVVYCAPTGISKKDVDQSFKEHKSPEHLEAVLAQHSRIVNDYENFFATQKNTFKGFYKYNWRKPDSYEKLVKYLEENL